MFSSPSVRNFLVVFPDPQLNSKSQRQCTFVTTATVPLAPHTWFWGQSYEALHGAATRYKTSKMTQVHVKKFQCKHKLASKFKWKINILWNTETLSNINHGNITENCYSTLTQLNSRLYSSSSSSSSGGGGSSISSVNNNCGGSGGGGGRFNSF